MVKSETKVDMLTKIKGLITQMIPIILGVLIGLLINDWKESYDEKKYLKKALNAIEQDVVGSRASVLSVLDSQQVVMDSLEYYLEIDSVSLIEIFYKTEGLDAPTMKDIAMEFFTSDRGDLIDYELISIMAEIKDGKILINEKFDRLADFINTEMYNSTYQAKEKTAILLADVMESESSMVKIYDSYLDQNRN
ncbi:MAG: hypothetical protein Sapg2KO_48230 [Saprospiraceae bacterium]